MEIEEFSLPRVGDRIVGATARLPKGSEIILTLCHGAQAYDVESRNVSRSWFRGPSIAFTTPPAIREFGTHRIIAVQNRTDIISWANADESLVSAPTRTMPCEVMALIDHTSLFGVTVLCSDRSVHVVDPSTLKERATYVLGEQVEGEVVRAAHVMTNAHSANIFIALLVQRPGASYQVDLYEVITADVRISHTATWTLSGSQGAEARLVQSAAVSEDTQSMLVSLLWSNGALDIFRLSPSTTGHSSPFITRRLTCFELESKNKTTAPSKKVKKGTAASSLKPTVTYVPRVAMAFLDQSYVAIVGPSSSGLNSGLLTVWDTRFGLVHLIHSLEESLPDQSQLSSPDQSTYGMTVSLKEDSNSATIVIHSTTGHVQVSEIHLPECSLASVIGRMSASLPLMDNSGPHPTPLSPIIDVKGITSLTVKDNALKAVMSKSCDSAVEKTYDNLADPLAFKDEATALKGIRNQFMPFVRRDGSTKPPSRGQHIHVPPVIVEGLVKHCLKVKWWAALEILLKTDLVSSSANPHLVRTLVEDRQFGLLELCLKHVYDLSEWDQIRSLKAAVEYAAVLRSSPIGQAEEDGLTRLSNFMSLVVSAHRNEIFLVQAMRLLDLKEVSVILAFLRRWIAWHDEEQAMGSLSEQKQQPFVPPLSLILEWTSFLLDAHFTALALREEFHQTIRDLKTRIQNHLVLDREIGSLSGLLEHLKLGKPMPMQIIGDYVVEEIEL